MKKSKESNETKEREIVYKTIEFPDEGSGAIFTLDFCKLVDKGTEYDPKTKEPIDGYSECLKITTLSRHGIGPMTTIELWGIDYDSFVKHILDQII